MPRGGTRVGAGRPPNTPNHITSAVKDMIRQALVAVGGADYFVEQAKKNPAAFMSLVGRIVPHEVTGADGEALTVRVWYGPKPSDEKLSDRDGG